MSSLFFILLCFWGALIIHLWFYSDFWTFYVKVFKNFIPSNIYNWLLIEEYLNNTDPTIENYPEFIFNKRFCSKNFFVVFVLKLFSCPICFTFWVALIISLILQNILYLGLCFFCLRVLDFILKFVLKKQVN
jgi:hypothetical protein